MGDNKYTKKLIEVKTMLEDWQDPSSAQTATIANKEEEGGSALVDQGKTAAGKKDPKRKCHGCGIVNENFLSD